MLGNLCLYSAEARYLQSKLVSWLICPGYSVPYNPISSKTELSVAMLLIEPSMLQNTLAMCYYQHTVKVPNGLLFALFRVKQMKI